MDNESIKILYVEDNEVDQLAFIQEIKKKAVLYDITIASSLTEALDRLHGNNFDLIIIVPSIPAVNIKL